MPSATELPHWSPTLVDRIAKDDFVLFIGAGVSANATNLRGDSPPDWRALLAHLNDEFCVTSKRVQQSVRGALRRGDYLAAAELISHYCDFKSLTLDFRNEIVRATDGGDTQADVFNGGELHDLIGQLNPRLIVTTNYDRILERHFQPGYRVKHFADSDIAATVRQGHPVIVKLHGSADAPERTILTRSDFTRLRRTGGHALETLQALLLTRTVLFLGYSLDDPDLRLLLENLFGAQGLQPAHYILCSNRIGDVDKAMLREVYGVHPLLYGGAHSVGVKRSLERLVEEVVSLSPVVSP